MSGAEYGNSKDVFEVCTALLSSRNEKEKDLSLLEVVEACGINFPRPRWWPKGEDFDP